MTTREALEVRRFSLELALLDKPIIFKVRTIPSSPLYKTDEYLEVQNAFFAYDLACLDGKFAQIYGIMEDGKIRVYEHNFMLDDEGNIVHR